MSSKSKRTKLVCRRQLSDQMIANRSLSRDPRVLPDAIANAADLRLRQPGVYILTGAAVTAIHEQAVELADGRRLETDIIVRAAVVKGPPGLRAVLDGFGATSTGQVRIGPTCRRSRTGAFLPNYVADTHVMLPSGRSSNRAASAREPLDFVLPNCRHRLDAGPPGLRRL